MPGKSPSRSKTSRNSKTSKKKKSRTPGAASGGDVILLEEPMATLGEDTVKDEFYFLYIS